MSPARIAFWLKSAPLTPKNWAACCGNGLATSRRCAPLGPPLCCTPQRRPTPFLCARRRSSPPRPIMPDASAPARPARARLVLAFGSVYLVWGSTFLAIRYAIETLPPLLMAGGRFIVAGSILYAWARLRGASLPERMNWGKAMVIGALLLLGGNGMVVLAERRSPSGLAGLLSAPEPMMIVLV